MDIWTQESTDLIIVLSRGTLGMVETEFENGLVLDLVDRR